MELQHAQFVQAREDEHPARGTGKGGTEASTRGRPLSPLKATLEVFLVLPCTAPTPPRDHKHL